MIRTLRWRADVARRLDDELAARLPALLERSLGRGLARRLVVAGVARVDGRVERRPGFVLEPGQSVEARVDVERLPAGPPAFDVATRVLYRDELLLAIDKPPGLPTVPTADPARPSLVSAVKDWLGDVELGVHQRLDRDTSGVVLFALAPAANASLAAQFEAREIEKMYLAVVESVRNVPASWTASEDVDGRPAETAFRVMQRAGSRLLIEARPRTGRKHQIRIHLAEAGLPILGDERYGRAVPGLRCLLHARELVLRHPSTGARLAISAPVPDDVRAALAAPASPRSRAPRGAGPRGAAGHPTRSHGRGRGRT